jgi:large subunit ribosomal protein L29
VTSLKAKDLHELDNDQLVQRLRDTRQELFNLRFQSATGALENTTRLKLAKREIARILTIQNERSLNVAGVDGR